MIRTRRIGKFVLFLAIAEMGWVGQAQGACFGDTVFGFVDPLNFVETNTYTGDTVVESDTSQINGSVMGNATVDGGTLALNAGYAVGGNTTICSGRLQIGADNALGTDNTLTMTGGQIQATGGTTSHSFEPVAAPPPVPQRALFRVARFSHQPWSGIDLEAVNPAWDTRSVHVVPPTPPPSNLVTIDGTLINDGTLQINPTGQFVGTGSFTINSGTLDYGSTLTLDPGFVHCPPPPVELLDSSQFIRANTHAAVELGDETFSATNGDSESSNQDSPFSHQLALIANVFDPNDVFLTGGSALASQDSDITTTRMTASGLITTDSLMDTGVAEGQTTTTATSKFTSSFRLNKIHDFTLDMDVSATEHVAVAISLENDQTGETIYVADPSSFDQETGTWNIFLEGFLIPGEYTVRAEALSDSSLDGLGTVEFGGEAAFDLQLDLMQLSSTTESAFLLAIVPEPTTLAVFVCGGLWITRRRSR